MRRMVAGAAVVLALASCGERSADRAAGSNALTQPSASADDNRIECAAAGAADLARDCTVERAETDRGLMLTISHPDGHFRRLLVTTDGRGVIAADGAQRAKVTIVDPGTIEVALGGDRYRLPAHQGTAPR